MRKWMKTGACVMAAMMLFTAGCSGKTGEAAESEAQSAESSGQEEAEENVAEDSVTLGEYKGLAVTVKKAEVSEEELENAIQYYLESQATFDESESEAAELGDKVNIDFKGLLDGEAFDGGTSEGYELELGSNSFIEGFEDGLVGAKKGEKRSLNLTFPESYGKSELAGQDVVFEVTVNSVLKKSVPQLDDEFVASFSPEDGTVEKFRESVRESLLEAVQKQIDNQRDTELVNKVIENSEVQCATSRVDEMYNSYVTSYTNMAMIYGMDLAGYAAQMGMDEEGLKSELRRVATDLIKQELVLKEIAAQEGLTVDDSDKEALAKEYGYESVEKLLEASSVTEENVAETALMQKALDLLVENAEITVEE